MIDGSKQYQEPQLYILLDQELFVFVSWKSVGDEYMSYIIYYITMHFICKVFTMHIQISSYLQVMIVM